MTGPAHSHTEVVTAVGRALGAFEAQATVAADAALSAARRVVDDVERARSERRHQLDQAEQELRRCQADPDADCAGAAARVALQRRRFESARRACELAGSATRELTASRARFLGEVSSLVTPGRATTTVKLGELEAYLHAAGGGGHGSSSFSSVSAVGGSTIGGAVAAVTTGAGVHGGAGLPAGYELIPVDLVDVADPVAGPAEFTKGYSPESLAWAFTAFDDVVLPALAAGENHDYFSARDAAEQRMGTRSYSDTHSGFLDDQNAIVVTATPDGRYSLTQNGRHRVWVAQQTCRSTIPAKVLR